MAIIRKDRHGLYVTTNGGIYRPNWTPTTYGMYAHVAYAQDAALDDYRKAFRAQVSGTSHSEGESVNARAISGTQRATINGKTGETWMKHPPLRLADRDSRDSEKHWRGFDPSLTRLQIQALAQRDYDIQTAERNY